MAAGGSRDGQVCLFNHKGDLLWKHKTGGVVDSVSISSDGKYVVAGTCEYEGKIYFFNHNGDLLWSYDVAGNIDPLAITPSVAISSDGRYVAAGGGGKVSLFSQDGDLLRSHRTDYSVYSVAISSDGRYVAAGGGGKVSLFTNADILMNGNWNTNYVPEPPTIGNAGPAGGLIFYDKGSYSDGWRYLEAAPVSTEWSLKRWSSSKELIGVRETGIGTGQSNTAKIMTWLNSHSETSRAAQLCDALVYGGYSDWFLPSKDELRLMYRNLHLKGVGGFTSGGYWSSSEYDASNAWGQSFANGGQNYDYKYGAYRVRAVRAF